MRLLVPGKDSSPVPSYVTVVAYTQVWMLPRCRVRSRQTRNKLLVLALSNVMKKRLRCSMTPLLVSDTLRSLEHYLIQSQVIC